MRAYIAILITMLLATGALIAPTLAHAARLA